MNETELLFTDILNCQRHHLYLERDLLLNREQRNFIRRALHKRIKAEPIQYILGKAEFMGLVFRVNRHVFIPRPETEILVDIAVKFVSSLKPQVSKVSILDIGTGSGCIAVSLVKCLPQVEVEATDISPQALEIARLNARLNKVGERIKFTVSDLFNSCDLRPATCDLIVSNPPYIPTPEIENLEPEVRYEPRLALDAGKDGLDFYRRIINESPSYLKPDGLLIMEMGYAQRQEIEKMIKKSNDFEVREIVKDYNKIDRVIVAKRKRRNG